MTVGFRKGRLGIKLAIPARLLIHIVNKKFKRDGEAFALTKEAESQLLNDLKKAKKIHGRIKLVSVKTADGFKITVTL